MLNIGRVFKTKYFVYHKRTRLAMECYPTIKALKSLNTGLYSSFGYSSSIILCLTIYVSNCLNKITQSINLF